MARRGINIRQTASYVTDGAGETYSLGEAYPTERGDETFGFSENLAAASRNRLTNYGPRLAGSLGISNAGPTKDFLWDLKEGPGTYRMWLALGDGTNVQANQKAVILDGATVLASIAGSMVVAPSFFDAAGVLRSTGEAWLPPQQKTLPPTPPTPPPPL